MFKKLQRYVAAAACMTLASQLYPIATQAAPSRSTLRYTPYHALSHTYALRGGRTLAVDRNGFATLYDAHHKMLQARWIPASALPHGAPGSTQYQEQVTVLEHVLDRPLVKAPFAPDHVLVVFRDGVSPSRDTFTVPGAKPGSIKTNAAAGAPSYTNDPRVNSEFAALGVWKVERLFASMDRSRLSTMHSMAQARTGRALLNVANAYSVSIGNQPVLQTLRALRAQPGIAYVSPDWTVTTMNPIPRALPDAVKQAMRQTSALQVRRATSARTASGAAPARMNVPSNFGVTSSLQSLLNSSNLDVIAAYDEIVQQYHQLPGTGEIITNVSIGDDFAAEDAGGVATPSNLCPDMLQIEGPTMHMMNGQRYLDWPGLPLIPAYAADPSGHTDPSYVACGISPLDEVGLDFSMMAPLPDEQQRAGEQSGQALGDLLGIAPGAQYRLFVPATNAGSPGSFLSAIDGVFIAAANMVPKTDVITASLGEGFDFEGFPGRYLEDDPLTEAVISTIVNADGIVVCISANDGMRSVTPTSIGPSGGSAATNATADITQTTSLNDVAFSTIPSNDLDSGAIDVGGTTLNDIFARPITDPQNAAFISQLAYPETRYDGGQYLSSGFGTRVNVSAPADNVIALSKVFPAYDGVDVFSEGGTSASAPEVAAVAAVVMQVAKLAGHPFTSAVDVRKFLVSTAIPIAQTPQTDQPLNVGPQVNVRNAVEQLMAAGGVHLSPSVQRIGIAQRKSFMPLDTHGAIFFSNTDPTNINLNGIDYNDGRGPDGTGNTDPITIAPDWEAMPAGINYSLYVSGHPDKVLATTPFARLMPQTILAAAGLPLASPSSRTVHLTYRAGQGLHALAQASFDLTFGASDGTSMEGLAPAAPAVVSGSTFSVTYDVSTMRNMTGNPMLVVTEPGRFASSSSYVLHMLYEQPLTASSGTVTVPVSALQGAGLYGVGVMSTDPMSGAQYLTDMATLRVQQVSASRAAAPAVQVNGSNEPFAHMLEFGFTDSLNVKWDVSNVPNANGALLEVSAPGPTLAHLLNTFNNPNGSIADNDGVNTGSVKLIALGGVSGTQTFKVSDLGLNPAMLQQIRVIPVNGQNPVGEASDVTSLITDGIHGALGGWIDDTLQMTAGGFAIDPNGTDGFLADVVPLANAQYETSIDLFDQNSGASSVATGAFTHGPFGLLGGGYYANSIGFFAENQYAADATNAKYYTINTAAQGMQWPSGVWLPSATDQVIQTSYSPESSKMAYLSVDGSQQPGTVAPVLRSYDFSSRTFGPPIATPLSTSYNWGITLFNADMSLNKAVIGRAQNQDFTGYFPAYFDVIDLQTGALTEYRSQTLGMVAGMAVDPATHLAMTGSSADNSVVIFNLQTGAQQKVALPFANSGALQGGLSAWSPSLIAADPVNHLFLVSAMWGPGITTADYNATSPIYVYDESGNLVKTILGWAWNTPGNIVTNGNAYLQVNGTTRKAYLMMGTQIGVISY